MDYNCEICLENIKPQNKYKYFKSKSHQEFDKSKQILLSLKDIDINYVDEELYLYLVEHNKKFDYCLTK